MTKDEYYLNIAKAVCMRSTCIRRRYGAVIVKDGQIISTGYNGSPRGTQNCCDVDVCKRIDMEHNTGDYSECCSVHAEQNAIIHASRKEMLGSTMYLYGEEMVKPFTKYWYYKTIENPEPCPICLRMIQNAGIKRVINLEGDLWDI